MTPSMRYAELLRQPRFFRDPAQQQLVSLLDDLHRRILHSRPPTWWQRKFSKAGRWASIDGLYLWGGVGRGKTMLMDVFYQSLPESVSCERIHFHRFINQVHVSLRRMGRVENPLRKLARRLASETQVFCLDEFVITDIGDAMIMAGLLEALFDEGVVLITTSNVEPCNLYKNGLQRARFIPAIKLLEQHCQIINVDGEQDYRLLCLRQTELYITSYNADTLAMINHYLNERVMSTQTERGLLEINGRELAHQFCAEDTVWFTFAELCETTRSQDDYLELARLFNTMILTEVRLMHAIDDDIARRFVLLIDVLYDCRMKLICSAAAWPTKLYRGQRLAFEFKRTASRLLEMQSEDYLAKARRSV